MTTATKIEYGALDLFRKDLKRLLKKFRTLEEDLRVAKRDAIEFYHLRGLNNGSVFEMPGFCSPEVKVCKVKKFTCKSLRGRGSKSGIRLIYAFHNSSRQAELIEIYFKGEKKNEDQERIKNYLHSIK